MAQPAALSAHTQSTRFTTWDYNDLWPIVMKQTIEPTYLYKYVELVWQFNELRWHWEIHLDGPKGSHGNRLQFVFKSFSNKTK